MKNLLYLCENWYAGISEISDYESSLKILEFKIADQNVNTCLVGMKIWNRRFLRSLIILSQIYSTVKFNKKSVFL